MARYRRRYRRRNNRKRVTGKKLSTIRVMANKSATSQAKQIVALRNSVNRVRRMLPPINKMTSAGQVQRFTFSSSDFTNVGTVIRMPMPSRYEGNDGEPIESNDIDYRTGNWIKIHSAYCTFNISYNFTANSGTTNYDGVYSGAQVRFVLLAARRASQYAPTLGSIFENYGTTGDTYNLNMVSPLAEGISSEWIVLGQRKKTLSTTNRLMSFRLHFPLRRIKNYVTWDLNNELYFPKHQLYIVILTSGLKYQSVLSTAVNGIEITARPWTIYSNP